MWRPGELRPPLQSEVAVARQAMFHIVCPWANGEHARLSIISNLFWHLPLGTMSRPHEAYSHSTTYRAVDYLTAFFVSRKLQLYLPEWYERNLSWAPGHTLNMNVDCRGIGFLYPRSLSRLVIFSELPKALKVGSNSCRAAGHVFDEAGQEDTGESLRFVSSKFL